jgi:hypothetical protein
MELVTEERADRLSTTGVGFSKSVGGGGGGGRRQVWPDERFAVLRWERLSVHTLYDGVFCPNHR